MDKKIIPLLVLATLVIVFFVPWQESYQVSYQDPVYKTEYYQDSTYVTDLTLGMGFWNSGLTLYDVKSYSCQYTNTGILGTNYFGCTVDGKYYEGVQSWNPTQRSVTVTKSRQVIDHYDTKYRTEYRTETLLNKLLGN